MKLKPWSSNKEESNNPQKALNDALASFKTVLTVDQREALKNSQPEEDVDKVMIFTAKLGQKARSMKGRSVASRLHAVLESIHLFSTVVDTFVSSNPEIAALVWGSIKLTMLIMINYTSYFEPLSKLFLTISTHCPRFTEYKALFPARIRLQRALCDFHAAIICCCQHVVEVM
ncbi:fungal STAND Goodbye domain-containing protein [Microdochium nivale]|nr:fungal STAND Goodbye domain-containing protein [Microdochium nivale]